MTRDDSPVALVARDTATTPGNTPAEKRAAGITVVERLGRDCWDVLDALGIGGAA